MPMSRPDTQPLPIRRPDQPQKIRSAVEVVPPPCVVVSPRCRLHEVVASHSPGRRVPALRRLPSDVPVPHQPSGAIAMPAGKVEDGAEMEK